MGSIFPIIEERCFSEQLDELRSLIEHYTHLRLSIDRIRKFINSMEQIKNFDASYEDLVRRVLVGTLTVIARRSLDDGSFDVYFKFSQPKPDGTATRFYRNFSSEMYQSFIADVGITGTLADVVPSSVKGTESRASR